jgi:hypothetical protein
LLDPYLGAIITKVFPEVDVPSTYPTRKTSPDDT